MDLRKLVKSRTKAKELGHKYYYTGVCKNGHKAPRFTSNTHCMQCSLDNAHARNNRVSLHTPDSLSATHRQEIEDIYNLCKRLNKSRGGRVYHVDHTLPLAHSNFSGLHVPWNLQIVKATPNLKKGNRL